MAEVWRIKFGGNEATAGPEVATPDPLKADPGKSKRKDATALKKANPVADGPRTPEALALEAKIAEQGLIVRGLKGQTLKTPELEEQIKAAVDVLKALKAELETELQKGAL